MSSALFVRSEAQLDARALGSPCRPRYSPAPTRWSS